MAPKESKPHDMDGIKPKTPVSSSSVPSDPIEPLTSSEAITPPNESPVAPDVPEQDEEQHEEYEETAASRWVSFLAVIKKVRLPKIRFRKFIRSNSSASADSSLNTTKTRWLNYPSIIKKIPVPQMNRSNSIRAIIAIAIIVVGGYIINYINAYLLAEPGDNHELITDTVITDDTKLAIDITIHMEIVILGQKQIIPSSFGRLENGRSIVNSNTDDGTVRIQSPKNRKFFLTDFFIAWGAPFSRQCIFSHCANAKKKLTMYVNGEVNKEYEKYQIQDGDNIRIILEEIN